MIVRLAIGHYRDSCSESGSRDHPTVAEISQAPRRPLLLRSRENSFHFRHGASVPAWRGGSISWMISLLGFFWNPD